MFYIADNGKSYEEQLTLFFHLPDQVPQEDVDALLRALDPKGRVLCAAKVMDIGSDMFGDFPIIPFDFVIFDSAAKDIVMTPGPLNGVVWSRVGEEPSGTKWRRPARWRDEMFDGLSSTMAEIVFGQMRGDKDPQSAHDLLDMIRAEWFRRYLIRRG